MPKTPHKTTLPPTTPRGQRLESSPCTWDKKLANYASQYVSEKLIGDCNLEHSGGPYGENLAAGGATDFDGADAVKMWVSEKPYYNYDSNSCVGGECGHYTQVV
uniref:SCP domain-containing protein n=1 Tax=Vitis vinifera TaxID=29760 RepID=A5BKE4_VITVI|nr:hypothetical protein VITISV_036361 [Vitis vinifera]